MAEQQTFLHAWRALWAQHADTSAGQAVYTDLLIHWEQALERWVGKLALPNGVDAAAAVRAWVTLTAVRGAPRNRPGSAPAVAAPRAAKPTHLAQPVFIVAAPRSGSSLLFETLAQASNVYTLGGESHAIFENITALRPDAHQFASNRLDAADATPAVVQALHQAFLAAIHDRTGMPPPAGTAVRLLEKTPKNALRIPLLYAAFPNARFIFLHRAPQPNIASIMEAWRSGRFVTYPHLPGWQGLPWSLLLTPHWRDLPPDDLAAIAAAQWDAANRCILADLADLPAQRWCAVRYEAFIANPQAEVLRLAHFAGFTWDRPMQGPLPASRHTLTPPNPSKWEQHAGAMAPHVPKVAETTRRLAALHAAAPAPATPPQVVARPADVASAVGSPSGPGSAPRAAPTTSRPAVAAAPPAADAASPAVGAGSFSSVHTLSMPPILRELQISLFVSTYQAGKVVFLRANAAGLNTHFRDFKKPMGLALSPQGLAIGTANEVHRFANVPAVGRRVEGGDRLPDACFLPRSMHVTGNIQVHDIDWGHDELWCVNTSFSCLSTLAPDVSFVPRWQPRFITALAPEDRCHLNGLAMDKGKPRFVTALAQTDHRDGWRAHKREGGVVIDVQSHEVVAHGLCMPHSPRWHMGALWVLNSGIGGVGTVDLSTGRYQSVATLPGFTRGLSFVGRYAFVGLSQVRETATFGEIPIAGLPIGERRCGVWVLDTVTGHTLGFVRFEGAVQEIFSVQVAQGMQYPDLLLDDTYLANSFVLPSAALSAVPNAFQKHTA